MTEPMYLISESELDQIKNDCLYPDRPSCEGCECAEGIDPSRASGLGCTFKGANLLMDEVIARGPVQQAPSDDVISGLISENARVGAELKHANETISRLNGEHDAAIAAQAREDVLTKAWVRIETVSPDEGIHLGWVLLSEVKAALDSLRSEVGK